MPGASGARLRRLATPAVSLRADLVLWLGVLRWFRGAPVSSTLLFVAVGLATVAVFTLTGPAAERTRGPWVRRWVVQGLIVAEAVVLAGFPHTPYTVQSLVVLELCLVAVALTSLPSLRRQALLLRGEGKTSASAYVAAFAANLPPEFRRLAIAEIVVLETAVRYVLRRPAGVRAGDVVLPYGRSARTLMFAFSPAALAELAVTDYFLRATPLRWPVLVLGVLSLPYLLGFVATSRVYPHLLRSDRLVLRSGTGFSVEVPLTLVSGWSCGFRLDGGRLRVSEGCLCLPSSGQTDVRLLLREPLETALGACTVIEVALDPEAAIQLREELIARGV